MAKKEKAPEATETSAAPKVKDESRGPITRDEKCLARNKVQLYTGCNRSLANAAVSLSSESDLIELACCEDDSKCNTLLKKIAPEAVKRKAEIEKLKPKSKLSDSKEK